MGLRIGGSLGKLIKKAANTKVLGVSVGSMLGATPLGAVGTIVGTKARGGSLKDNLTGDFKAGLGNAAKIFPMAKAMGGANITGAPPGASGGPDDGLTVTGRDAFGNKTYDTSSATRDVTDPELLKQWAAEDAAAAGGGASPAGSRFRSVMGSMMPKSGEDWLDLAQTAGSVYGGYKQGQREDELYNRDKSDWNSRAPLRQAGMAGMLNSSRPDLSSTFADPNDPQGRYRKVSVGSRG